MLGTTTSEAPKNLYGTRFNNSFTNRSSSSLSTVYNMNKNAPLQPSLPNHNKRKMTSLPTRSSYLQNSPNNTNRSRNNTSTDLSKTALQMLQKSVVTQGNNRNGLMESKNIIASQQETKPANVLGTVLGNVSTTSTKTASRSLFGMGINTETTLLGSVNSNTGNTRKTQVTHNNFNITSMTKPKSDSKDVSSTPSVKPTITEVSSTPTTSVRMIFVSPTFTEPNIALQSDVRKQNCARYEQTIDCFTSSEQWIPISFEETKTLLTNVKLTVANTFVFKRGFYGLTVRMECNQLGKYKLQLRNVNKKCLLQNAFECVDVQNDNNVLNLNGMMEVEEDEQSFQLLFQYICESSLKDIFLLQKNRVSVIIAQL